MRPLYWDVEPWQWQDNATDVSSWNMITSWSWHHELITQSYNEIIARCNEIPIYTHRADSRFAPSQWETALLCNDISHWLGTNLDSALHTQSTRNQLEHYNDIIMRVMASQITSLTIVYWTIYSGTDQRKHQSSALLAFVRGIHRWPVNSPYKGPVTRKLFPFDDVIMSSGTYFNSW